MDLLREGRPPVQSSTTYKQIERAYKGEARFEALPEKQR